MKGVRIFLLHPSLFLNDCTFLCQKKQISIPSKLNLRGLTKSCHAHKCGKIRSLLTLPYPFMAGVYKI